MHTCGTTHSYVTWLIHGSTRKSRSHVCGTPDSHVRHTWFARATWCIQRWHEMTHACVWQDTSTSDMTHSCDSNACVGDFHVLWQKDTKGINCSACSFLGVCTPRHGWLSLFLWHSSRHRVGCNRLWPTPGDPPPHVTTSIFGICTPRDASLSLCVTLQSTLLTAMDCIGDLPPNFASSVLGMCTSRIVWLSFFVTQQSTLCWRRRTVSEICPLPAPLLFWGYAHLEIFDFVFLRHSGRHRVDDDRRWRILGDLRRLVHEPEKGVRVHERCFKRHQETQGIIWGGARFSRPDPRMSEDVSSDVVVCMYFLTRPQSKNQSKNKLCVTPEWAKTCLGFVCFFFFPLFTFWLVTSPKKRYAYVHEACLQKNHTAQIDLWDGARCSRPETAVSNYLRLFFFGS